MFKAYSYSLGARNERRSSNKGFIGWFVDFLRLLGRSTPA